MGWPAWGLEPSHAERVEQAEEAGEERHEQRNLQRAVSRLLVDAEDLGLDVLGLLGEQRSSCALLITSASSSSVSAICCCCAGGITVLSLTGW